jgi:hypothetical protein
VQELLPSGVAKVVTKFIQGEMDDIMVMNLFGARSLLRSSQMLCRSTSLGVRRGA